MFLLYFVVSSQILLEHTGRVFTASVRKFPDKSFYLVQGYSNKSPQGQVSLGPECFQQKVFFLLCRDILKS